MLPSLKPKTRPGAPRFHRSLARTITMVMLLTSLISILVIGLLTAFHLRSLLYQQVSSQAESVVSHEISQVSEYVSLQKSMADRLVTDENFNAALMDLLNKPAETDENLQARAALAYIFRGSLRTSAAGSFDQVFILRPDGTVAIATDNRWVTGAFGGMQVEDGYVHGLIGTNKAEFSFQQATGLPGALALYITRSVQNPQGQLVATLVAIATSLPGDLPYRAISSAGTLMPGAQSYYFNSEIALLGIQDNTLKTMPGSPEITSAVLPLAGSQNGVAPSQYRASAGGQPAMIYARWIPDLNLGVMLVVPDKLMPGFSAMVDPSILGLLALALVLSVGLIVYAGARLTRPLARLSQAADHFSAGDWSARAEVYRTDEMGLLAYAFNHMAEALSQQRQPPDTKGVISEQQTPAKLEPSPSSGIETTRPERAPAPGDPALASLQERLSQLQTLASFSQAISAETDLEELYRVMHAQVTQTVGSGVEFAVAIYNRRQNLVEFPYFYEDGQVIAISPATLGQGLTSMIIQTGRPMLFENEAQIRANSPIIAGRPARSWMGIPLVFAGEVLGAVLVQDLEQENRFTQEDIDLFMTLAPQIAIAVRNAQLYTEAQQALKAYDQERFLLNTLLDHIPEGITFKDTQGQYIRASHSVAQLFGIPVDEMPGKTNYELMDRAAAEKVARDEQRVLSTGRSEIGLIQRVAGSSGQDTWSHTSLIPIDAAGGEPYGLLVITRDITELKLAEALAQRRAEQVLTAAEIARDTTGTLEIKTLLEKAVTLVRERFGYFHASIFLVDAPGQYAVLRESTGSAGQTMLQAGHRLAVGSKSIVGQVTSNGWPLVVNNILEDPTHLPNPLLPDTRSELAIPLKVGDRILGALDVQSQQANAFKPEDVSVLEILADQLAVAVVNGELFAKTQELLGKHRLLRQITIAAGASTNLDEALSNVVNGLHTAMVGDRIFLYILDEEGELRVQATAGYEATGRPVLDMPRGIVEKVAEEKQPIRVDDTASDPAGTALDPEIRSELAVPILFSGELLGVLDLQGARVAAFDENDQEILGALGNNLGGVIANIRLINQVRQQVVRERQLFDVTSKIRHSVDLETILETSTKEIARALGARRASIRITAGTSPRSGEQPAMNSHKNGREEDR